MKKVLGRFKKGVTRSRHLSIARSATANCDKKCEWYGNGCYAAAIDSGLYPALNRKLKRLERADDSRTLDRATYEVSRLRYLEWFRFFALGAAPMPDKVRHDRRFKRALIRLCRMLREKIGTDGRVHFPVESWSKWRLYHSWLAPIGVVVRESLQSRRRLKSIGHPCSIVVGRHTRPADRLEECMAMADNVRQDGSTVVVCPAVVGSSQCGRCTACGDSRVDLVIYPFHR